MKKVILSFFIAGLSLQLCAQETAYKARAMKLNDALNKHLKVKGFSLYYENTGPSLNENKYSWLWPLCAYIQAANEMEVIDPGVNYMDPVVKAIEQYWTDAGLVPAYQDYLTSERESGKFYDDNEWIAIAYLDAYKRTQKKMYLQESMKIYDFLLYGLDSVAGGGIYWKKNDMTTKNTCSNGPAILVALKLYQLNPKKEYLDTAISIYEWTKRNLQAPDGVYWDHVKIPSLTIDKRRYTYNTGTMLQSAVMLYNITKNEKYLEEAKKVAQAGRDHFFKDNRLPKEYWFNAVMLRGYMELYKVDKKNKWVDFFKTDADLIWKTERNTENLVGKKTERRLIDQAAMIEIYALLSQLKNLNKK